MNLEPLIAMVGSGLALGDVVTPLQGSGIMLAALVAFQLVRRRSTGGGAWPPCVLVPPE